MEIAMKVELKPVRPIEYDVVVTLSYAEADTLRNVLRGRCKPMQSEFCEVLNRTLEAVTQKGGR
jgi:hypothetical protein